MSNDMSVQDRMVTATARNEAVEIFPDSINFDRLSIWSTGPTPDDDLVHVFIGMKDNEDRKVKLMNLAFYPEDLQGGKLVEKIHAGLEEFRKNHGDTLVVLSNYWKEQKREEYILREREKAGTIPVDKDGKPINQFDRELINDIRGENNWLSRMQQSFEEAYRAEILYPTGYFMPKEGIMSPAPEDITLKEYKYFDDKLRYEMHDPRKADKENYKYELRTPKMKASLANYYDYIHSQDRAYRKQCIQDLRENVGQAIRGFFKDRKFPDEKTLKEEKSRRNQDLEIVKLNLNPQEKPKNRISSFTPHNVRKGIFRKRSRNSIDKDFKGHSDGR